MVRDTDRSAAREPDSAPPDPKSSSSEIRYTAMYALSAFVAILALVLHMTSAIPAPEAKSEGKYFNVTTTAAKNNKSVIQCWQISAPITVSSQPGTQGSSVAFLGDTANITYSVIPANTNGGLHNAPAPQ